MAVQQAAAKNQDKAPATEKTKQAEQTTQTAAEKTLLEKVIDNTPDIAPGFGSLRSFLLVQRAAKLLSTSTLVPKEYQGNISNCVIALNMANRMGADPLMVMQNLVIVYNRPTWSSPFMIATVNTCGRFTALRFEFFGDPKNDSWGCRAWAIEKATGEKLVGSDITIGLARKEKWYERNGSKWQTMPQQMLMYRAGSWWARAYAPELSMGLHTEDEIHDAVDPFDLAEELKAKEIEANANKGVIDVTPTDPGDLQDNPMTEEEKAEALAREKKEGEQQKMGPGF